ncbi:MAG: amidohydrolase, partial [Gemmatimonadales bacterium]
MPRPAVTPLRARVRSLALRATALVVIAAAVSGSHSRLGSQQVPADLIVTNARIYTVDDTRPVVEAIAVRGGRIAFAGDARGALTL